MATTDARLAAPAAPGSRLFETVLPMLRALLWAVSGFVTAAWLTALIAGSDLTAELPVTIGYVFAIAGWVLGGGAWEGWVVPWFGCPSTWDESERSEEHTSELQSLMRISYAVFCLKKTNLIQ